MTVRYAYIVEGQTVWGPGPNPYFINLIDGKSWEILGHTVEESEQVGIFVVEQVNKKDFDPRFEEMYTPVYSIVDGRPIESYTYGFIPTARDNMLDAVDEYSEKLREVFSSKYAGQYAEYDEVYREALEVSKLSENATIDPNNYPYLSADLEITYSPDLGRVVKTIKEAAQLVIKTKNNWNESASIIRKLRLKTKKEIKNETSISRAYEICVKYTTGETYSEYLDTLLT